MLWFNSCTELCPTILMKAGDIMSETPENQQHIVSLREELIAMRPTLTLEERKAIDDYVLFLTIRRNQITQSHHQDEDF